MFPETLLGLLACAAAVLFFVIFRHKLGGFTKEQNEEIARYLDSGHFYHVKGVELGEQGDHRGAEHYFRLEVEYLHQSRPPGDPDLHRARENLAVCLGRQNRPDEAEAIYREQLSDQEETIGKSNPATHGTRLNLARALRMQGKLGEAEALLGEQAAINDRLFGQRDGEENNDILLERAAIHSARGEHDKAHEELVDIIADKGRRLGDQHPETLRFKRIMAGELHLRGSNAEAETLFQDILRDQKRIEAEDDIFVTRQRLADFYLATGRAEEAVAIHDELVRQLQDSLPPDHPDIYRLAGQRAIALEASGNPVRGEMLLRGALVVLEREYGPDHIDVISHRETLANILERRDSDSEAGEQFRLLVDSLERVYGEESLQVWRGRFNYGSSLFYQGRNEEALPELRQAHAALARLLGKDSPETLRSLERYARLLNQQERFSEARGLLESHLAAADSALKGFVEQWSYLDTLAIAQSADGDYPEAEKTWRRLLPLLEEGVGVESTGALRLLENLAENLNKQERSAEAEAILLDLCARTEKAAGPESTELLWRRRKLAETRQKLERWCDAESTWQEVIVACKKLEFEETLYYSECLEELAVCLRALKDKNAESCLRDAVILRTRLAAARETPTSSPAPSMAKIGMIVVVLLSLIRIITNHSPESAPSSALKRAMPVPRQSSPAFRDPRKPPFDAAAKQKADKASSALMRRAMRITDIEGLSREVERMRRTARAVRKAFGPKPLLAVGLEQAADVGGDVLGYKRIYDLVVKKKNPARERQK